MTGAAITAFCLAMVATVIAAVGISAIRRMPRPPLVFPETVEDFEEQLACAENRLAAGCFVLCARCLWALFIALMVAREIVR